MWRAGLGRVEMGGEPDGAVGGVRPGGGGRVGWVGGWATRRIWGTFTQHEKAQMDRRRGFGKNV